MDTIFEKLVIRSITLFAEKPASDITHYTDKLQEYIRILSDIERELIRRNYRVFTKRLSLPILDNSMRAKIVEKLEPHNTLVSLGIHKPSIDYEYVEYVVSNGYYMAIHGVWNNPIEYSKRVSEIIHRVSNVNPVYATRIAVAFHEDILETPYFPDSTSSGYPGLGISFLLPNAIIEYIQRGNKLENFPKELLTYTKQLEELLTSITGIKRIVVDYSISPWMNNSVVKLLEVLGYKLLSPGFNYGIYTLNSFIGELAKTSGNASGFNEVMLPYAEDLLLIEAGKEGLIRVRDFLLYASTCVAGVDMVVVPESIDKLANLVLDLMSIWYVKNKAQALRAIPVSDSVGTDIDLDKFGKVPVIDY
ncbi:MAG: DUF711 family protein [Thermoprotei archaeon]